MVFLNNIFFQNIGVPKTQISKSFLTFLKEYIKKMIEFYIRMNPEELMRIDIGEIEIQRDNNVYQYINQITENPETSQLIHDKIYGMIHHFVRFLVFRYEKCSFDSMISLINSEDPVIGIQNCFLKPIGEFYIERVNFRLIAKSGSIFIHRETFYLYIEICCTNLWHSGAVSNAFKDLMYHYFSDFLQHFQIWLKTISIFEQSDQTMQVFLEYISEIYTNDLGNHMRNQIMEYQESKRNWVNIHIFKINKIPEQFINYCKVIIQYLLVEFIYSAQCIARSNEKRKIDPIDLFLGMEDAELLDLPVFFKRLRNF